jgi:hypothetical protein
LGMCCSDKQAIDCLRQAGWSVEMGIDVFYASGMQVQVPHCSFTIGP